MAGGSVGSDAVARGVASGGAETLRLAAKSPAAAPVDAFGATAGACVVRGGGAAIDRAFFSSGMDGFPLCDPGCEFVGDVLERVGNGFG
jgi:hypothetical protein